MEDAPSVASECALVPSEVGQLTVGRDYERLVLPNSGWRIDEPIPYVLTEAGLHEVQLYRRALAQAAIGCQHWHRIYDREDQLYACDDCGTVWPVVWKGGDAFEGDPL